MDVRLLGRLAIASQNLSSITASTGISAPVILPVRFEGAASAGGASTITLAVNTVVGTAIEGMYDGWNIIITGGTGVGQQRIISGYVGSTRVATVSAAWATQPDNTSKYMVFPARGEGLEAQVALIKVETATINFCIDGTVPTVAAGTNLGIQLAPAESLIVDDVQNIKNFRCINTVNASGSVVKVITFA